MKARAQAARVPVPVLSPRSPVPITLKFPDQSLQKILESLGKLAGVNVVFDADYRDKRMVRWTCRASPSRRRSTRSPS